MATRALYTAADLERAKRAAEKAGLCLKGCEFKPDGSIKLEFGDWADNDDWRAGTRYQKLS